MRYNESSGHWELWDDRQKRWVDLYTCDVDTALVFVRQYMEAPESEWDTWNRPLRH